MLVTVSSCESIARSAVRHGENQINQRASALEFARASQALQPCEVGQFVVRQKGASRRFRSAYSQPPRIKLAPRLPRVLIRAGKAGARRGA